MADVKLRDDDEWETIMRKQKEEAERFWRNKALADSDEALARQLAEGSPTTQGSASSQDTYRPRQNDVFDRMLNRSRPFQSPYIKPDHGPSAVGSNAVQHRTPLEREPVFGPLQSRLGSTAQPFGSHVRPEANASRPSKREAGYQMPGAFVDSDDDDDAKGLAASSGDIGGPYGGRDWLPEFGRPSLPSSLTLPQRPAGMGYDRAQPFSSTSMTNTTMSSAMEQARQAALARQRQLSMEYGHGFDNVDLTSPFAELGPARDLLTPDSSKFGIGRPGYVHGGHYYGQPPYTAGSSSLAATINRVNRYDFDNFTDADGNQLNSHLVDYLHDLVDDPRKTEEEIQNLLSNIRPDMDIPQEERGETPEALKYPLYPHQQLALTWMTAMEEGSNKGGILADDMGLGKTISMLAIMASRQASSGVRVRRISPRHPSMCRREKFNIV